MNHDNLFQKGEAAFQQGNYFKALRCFLQLKEKRFDLLYTFTVDGEVRKLRLQDVDNNGVEEIGVLSKQKQFYVFPSKNENALYSSDKSKRCLSFGINGRQEIVLAEQSNSLSLYKIANGLKEGLTFERNLPVTLSDYAILDIVFKNNRLFVATTQPYIYLYSGMYYEQQHPLKVTATIKKLFTGGKGTEENVNSKMYMKLLGISNQGALFLYDIRQNTLEEERQIGQETTFLDVFTVDLDNDGSEDIIACTQNGQVIVYDFDSAEKKYCFSCFDEFYSLICNDIDNDGNIEILVGSKSHYIYVLGLKNNELIVKWKYKTAHQVWALRIRDNGGRKELIAGLANGEIHICQIFTDQNINTQIAQVTRKLRQDSKTFFQKLLQTKHVEIISYGLDFFLHHHDKFIKLVDYIRTQDNELKNKLSVIVFDKLRNLLTENPNNGDLLEITKKFIAQLEQKQLDATVCEKIETILHRFARDNSDVQLFLLAENFQKNLQQKRVIQLQKVKLIETQLHERQFTTALQHIEELEQTKIDLLHIFQAQSGILNLYATREQPLIALAKNNKSVVLVDIIQSDRKHHFSLDELPLFYSALNHTDFKHLIVCGMSLLLYDEKYNKKEEIKYERTVQCVQLLRDTKEQLSWVVGLRNGKIVVGSPEAQNRISFKYPTYAVKILKYSIEKDKIAILFITLDAKLYVIPDICHHLSSDTPPAYDILPSYTMIVDLLALGDNRFLIVSDTQLYFVNYQEEQLKQEQTKTINKELTCTALGQYRDQLHIVLGTQQQDLLFVSLQGEIQPEVIHLSNIPTALYFSVQQSTELVVGFDQGLLHHYKFISPTELTELRNACSEEEQYRSQWNTHSFREQCILIVLSTHKELTLDKIYEALDCKIKVFLPKESLPSLIKQLEQKEIIVESSTHSGQTYALKTVKYQAWINTAQVNQLNQLSLLEKHKKSLLEQINLVDIAGVPEREHTWLRDFMLISSAQYKELIALAQQFSAILQQEDSKSLRKEILIYLQKIAAKIEAKLVATQEYTKYVTAKLTIPSVKFQGFDAIFVIFVDKPNKNDRDALIDLIKQADKPKIVLIITSIHKTELKNFFNNESFNTAIFDQMDIKDTFIAEKPHQAFLDRLIPQINIIALSPFQTKGPVTDMFYGRNRERQTIIAALEHPAIKNYAVIGPRRVGKTSLLKKIQEEIADKKGIHSLFIDAMPYAKIEEWYQAILTKLNITQKCNNNREFITQIGSYCQQHQCTLILFIDEIDRLLNAQDGQDTLPSVLRALVNEARVKVVVAGYDTLYFQMRSDKSALFNLLEACELSALDESSARALIEEPLREVYSIEPEAISDIFEKTGLYPNFIQFCCSQLIEENGIHNRQISLEAVKKVTDSSKFFEHVTGIFLDNLDEKSKLILYLMICDFDVQMGEFIFDRQTHNRLLRGQFAGNVLKKNRIQDTFTPYDIHGLLEKYSLSLSASELDVVIKRMVLACVIKRKDKQIYTFVLPNLAYLLRKHIELEVTTTNLLEKLEQLLRQGQ